MATPWSDPRTGRFYLRRQIPAPLRASFGGRVLFKKALGTRDVREAKVAFVRENAAFEQMLASARETIATGEPQSASSSLPAKLVRRWFDGPALDGQLAGPQRLLLALMRLDTLAVEWMGEDCRPENWVAPGSTDWEALEGDRDGFDELLATYYRDDVNRVGIGWEAMRMEGGPDEVCRRLIMTALVPRLRAFDAAAAEHADALLRDAILARLDMERSGRLADIMKRPVAAEYKRPSRLRPTMRLRQLFREWKEGNQPRPQTALEYEAAVDDLIDFAGDPPVSGIDADLLYDYRDAAAKLPASMPRADRSLPFRERVAKHSETVTKVSASTLKKRIGGIQALLTYAFQQRWTADNAGRGVQVVGYTRTQRNRRSFEDHELAALFATPLFIDPASWATGEERAFDETLFWIFLLALTSGARLEEVGQAAIADVREDGDIVYLDIGEHVQDADAASKHVKTAESVRLVPIHQRLLDLGFIHYRDRVAAAGHASLFPALKENGLGKRTKELSRRANRLIDRHVSADERLVFHSLRHSFKAKGHDARLSDRTLDQLCGHAPITTGGRYGAKPRIRTIHRELHRIDFSCVDWSRITAPGKA